MTKKSVLCLNHSCTPRPLLNFTELEELKFQLPWNSKTDFGFSLQMVTKGNFG